ncbi:MAG: peptide chain release factor 2 [Bifidobacteriaceae bacterium]|nr:peptide chain release factor 2 [Bifidobacteriaceae bacterium]
MINNELRDKIRALSAKSTGILDAFDVVVLQNAVDELQKQSLDPKIWENPQSAGKINAELSAKQELLKTVQNLRTQIQDINEFAKIIETSGEEAELAHTVGDVEKTLSDLEIGSLMKDEFDELDAVLQIRTGAGGVDAQDFSEMLLRMYMRYGERKGYKVELLEYQKGDEAGIRSAAIKISGDYAFGRLKFEAGTHRLVRISPFNAQGKRQTSFTAVEVIPVVLQADEVQIDDKDLRIDVFRSSGPGGQSVNTTDSAVRITHLPTGIVVSMQNEKSQLQNKIAALSILKSKLLLMKKDAEAEQKRKFAGDVKATWSDQMRSYVMQPYQMVKDLRTGYTVNNVQNVLDGDIDQFLDAEIRLRDNE